MRAALPAVLAAAALVVTACAPARSPADAGGTAIPDAAEVPDVAAGAAAVVVPPGAARPETALPVFVVDVAATYAARERGLGGREALDDDRGMLFVYAESRSRRFWMKDCLVALDIAFLDEQGRVLEIATLPPGVGLTGDDVPAARCEGPVRFVLEVRAHRLAELGLAAGDLVDVRRAVAGVTPD